VVVCAEFPKLRLDEAKKHMHTVPLVAEDMLTEVGVEILNSAGI
jgi:hypothetical protein